MPRFRHARVVYAATQLVHKQRPIMPAADVFLARPNNLHRDRLAHRGFYRLNCIVCRFTGATTETATHERTMNRDVLLRDP